MSKGCQFTCDSCLGPGAWISGSGGVSALLFLFPISRIALGLKGPSLISVSDWSSSCFSVLLPASPDATCLPHFSSAAQVFRRAEAAASPVFFSATFGDTGGRRTQCGVFSSTPQVGTRTQSTHFRPLCMPGYICSSSLFSVPLLTCHHFQDYLLKGIYYFLMKMVPVHCKTSKQLRQKLPETQTQK